MGFGLETAPACATYCCMSASSRSFCIERRLCAELAFDDDDDVERDFTAADVAEVLPPALADPAVEALALARALALVADLAGDTEADFEGERDLTLCRLDVADLDAREPAAERGRRLPRGDCAGNAGDGCR